MDRSDSTHGSYDGLVSVRCHRRKLSNVRWYGQLDKSQPRLVLFSTLGKQFCHKHFWILKMIRYTNKGQHIFTCDLREVQAECCASLARDLVCFSICMVCISGMMMRPMPDRWTKLIRFEQGIPSTYKIYTDHIQAFLDRK